MLYFRTERKCKSYVEISFLHQGKLLQIVKQLMILAMRDCLPRTLHHNQLRRHNPDPPGMEKYYSHPKLILENVICGECGLKLKYKTSPSSFLQHLSNKHLVLNQTKEPGAKIKDFFQPAVKKTGIKYPEKHPTQRKFQEHLKKIFLLT